MGLIRLLLALSVVVTHADTIVNGQLVHPGFLGLWMISGQAAVQAFYVISGFYMALVLNRKYPPGAAGYRTFIAARVLRLFPAYFTVLLITIALAATQIVPHPAFERWRNDAPRMSLPTLALYAGSHATLIGQDAVWYTKYDVASGKAYFPHNPRIGGEVQPPARPPVADSSDPKATAVLLSSAPPPQAAILSGYDFLFVGQAWTLGVELLFYCVAPLIVRRVGTIGVMFALSWIIRLTLAHFGLRDDPWSYRFFPSELANFLAGSAAYHVYARLNRTLLQKFGWAAWAWMVLIILFLFQVHVHGKQLPLSALIIIFSMAGCVPFVFALTKDFKLDRWIGELSYPVYIVHETVRLALVRWGGGNEQVNVYALVGATLVTAILLMLGVEQPFEHVRARFVARRKATITQKTTGANRPPSATATPSGPA